MAEDNKNPVESEIINKISESTKKHFQSMKEMSRPGSLIKGAGAMTGSPMLMMMGDKLNDMLSSNKDEIQNDTDESNESQQKLAKIEENTTPAVDFEAEQRGDEQVERDELQLSFLEKMVAGLNSFGEKLSDLGKDSFLEDLLMLAGLTLAVVVAPFLLITGFFTGFTEFLVKIFKGFKAFTGGVSRIFKSIFGIVDKVDDIGVKGLDTLNKSKGLTGKIGKMFSGIKSFFGKIGSMVRGLGKFGASFMKLSGSIFNIGKLFGKIFPVIGMIMAVFETIKGMVQGFKTDGILGAFKGGMIGLINSIIGMPLDLLKDIAGWMLGKLGFENAKETLGNFSFQEMFKSLIDKLFAGVEMAVEFIKGIFAWEMPAPGTYDLLEIIGSAITKVFDWISGLFELDFEKILSTLPGYDLYKKLTGSDDPDEEPKKKKKSWWKWGGGDEDPVPQKQVEMSSDKDSQSIEQIGRMEQSRTEKQQKSTGDNNVQVNNSTTQQTSIFDISVNNPDQSLVNEF